MRTLTLAEAGQQLLAVLAAQVSSVILTTEGVATRMLKHLGNLDESAEALAICAEKPEEAVGDMKRISREMTRISMGGSEDMQFQDMTRQQLEHVVYSLRLFFDVASSSENGEMTQAQSDQLMHRIRDSYVMESERRIHDAAIDGKSVEEAMKEDKQGDDVDLF